jgi:hypothetical protein
MKKYFTVTYFVIFESEYSKHDRFERFWFWKAPDFFIWVADKRVLVESSLGKPVVVLNCAKI